MIVVPDDFPSVFQGSAAHERAKALGQPAITMKRPENGLPEDFRDHARLMMDIIALAFQTDKTRIASLMMARDLSTLYYPWLGVRAGHHELECLTQMVA